MKKHKYLAALMQQSADWIKRSAENPSQHMTKMNILLHYVALRRKQAI
jgi:hypothetical protein